MPVSLYPQVVLAGSGSAPTAAHSDHGHTKTVRVPHTWSVSGPLLVQSGANNYIPPFYVPVPSGQTVTIVAVRARVRAGSVTGQLTKNGSSVTGVGAVSVSTTAATTSATGGNTCADGDEIGLVLSSPSSADGLSFTVYMDITLTI